jgi:ferredoxin
MVVLVDGFPAPELHAAAHKAADLCPSQAITVEEVP